MSFTVVKDEQNLGNFKINGKIEPGKKKKFFNKALGRQELEKRGYFGYTYGFKTFRLFKFWVFGAFFKSWKFGNFDTTLKF